MKRALSLFSLIILLFPMLAQQSVTIKCSIYYSSYKCRGGAELTEDEMAEDQRDMEKHKKTLTNSSIVILSGNDTLYKVQTDTGGSFVLSLPEGKYSIKTNALDSFVEAQCRNYFSHNSSDKVLPRNPVADFSTSELLVDGYKKEYKILFLIPIWPCCDPDYNPE